MQIEDEKKESGKYILRDDELESDSQIGCFCTGFVAALILALVLLMSGCATCYVGILRQEYNEKGYIEGVYYGQEEYPNVYSATRIATMIEIPTWWGCGSEYVYQKGLRPIGMVMSLVDIPISVITDTIMLPYDIVKTASKAKERM